MPCPYARICGLWLAIIAGGIFVWRRAVDYVLSFGRLEPAALVVHVGVGARGANDRVYHVGWASFHTLQNVLEHAQVSRLRREKSSGVGVAIEGGGSTSPYMLAIVFGLRQRTKSASIASR